ncbi:hypothetical protein Acsp02_69030 [Actinoplanes sp. NBRC 103695]|nr:hypothetical protein Acsp02_69030 [Actinoplanes sp. NBRC 103695]
MYGLNENGPVDLYSTYVPPPLAEELSWRQLWRAGAFAQLDLAWDTNFSGHAKERGLGHGIGLRRLERLDIQGALQPIAWEPASLPRPHTV